MIVFEAIVLAMGMREVWQAKTDMVMLKERAAIFRRDMKGAINMRE